LILKEELDEVKDALSYMKLK